MVVFYNAKRAPPASFVPFFHVQVKEEQATLLQTGVHISENARQFFQAHDVIQAVIGGHNSVIDGRQSKGSGIFDKKLHVWSVHVGKANHFSRAVYACNLITALRECLGQLSGSTTQIKDACSRREIGYQQAFQNREEVPYRVDSPILAVNPGKVS